MQNDLQDKRPSDTKIQNTLQSIEEGSVLPQAIFKVIKECDRCPLMSRYIEIETNEGTVKKFIPGSCNMWSAGGKCHMNSQDFVQTLKAYYNYLNNGGDTISLQKLQILRTMGLTDAALNTEMIEYGKPGPMTARLNEQAMKYTTELNKIVHGEKMEIDTKHTDVQVRVLDVSAIVKKKLDEAGEKGAYPWEDEQGSGTGNQ